MTPFLESICAICEINGASDVHLTTGQPPRFREHGQLVVRPEFPDPMPPQEVDEAAMELGLSTLPIGCPDGTERVRATLMKKGSLDGAVSSADGSRYRFNIYRESSKTAVALRRLDSTFKTLEDLCLPENLADFCNYTDGLVIVTGPTGSGKSTTLATLIHTINTTRACHIITIEDPVEFIHESEKALVHQRQVGRDAESFNDALIDALRQDPDVILVGEIRDLGTVRTALRAAETGHLVFCTLHAGDCVGAVERFVSVFPPEEQTGVRRQFSMALKGIVAQHLVLSCDGSSRYAVPEVMVNTPAVANLIATGRTALISSSIETGADAGMRSLEESLAELVLNECIDEDVAYSMAHTPETLQRRLEEAVGDELD